MERNDPLDRLAHELKDLEARVTERAQPVRDRMERLGAGGLYALAAAEQRQADTARDDAGRMVHLAAAMAAEQLGDLQAAGQGSRRAS